MRIDNTKLYVDILYNSAQFNWCNAKIRGLQNVTTGVGT